MHDPLTNSLPAPIAAEGNYQLRKVDGALRIYLDYEDIDGKRRSMLVRDGIGYAEDFSTHVDDLEEEVRVMRANFMAYEMKDYV